LDELGETRADSALVYIASRLIEHHEEARGAFTHLRAIAEKGGAA
jgi:hypothetical protein